MSMMWGNQQVMFPPGFGCCCGCCPPQQNWPGIVGVTDGSNAAPGYVGEFVTGSSSLISFPATGTITTSASVITLTAGDWDLHGWISDFTAAVGGVHANLNPIPPGMSNDMTGLLGLGSGVHATSWVNMTGARANFATTTTLTWTIFIDNSVAGSTAGTCAMHVEARRRR